MNNSKLTVRYCASEDLLQVKPGDEETMQPVVKVDVVLLKLASNADQTGVVVSTPTKSYLFVKTRGTIPFDRTRVRAVDGGVRLVKSFDLQTNIPFADFVAFAEGKVADIQKNIVKTTDSAWCAELVKFLDPKISGLSVGSSVFFTDSTACLFAILVIGVFAYVACVVFANFSKLRSPKTEEPNSTKPQSQTQIKPTTPNAPAEPPTSDPPLRANESGPVTYVQNPLNLLALGSNNAGPSRGLTSSDIPNTFHRFAERHEATTVGGNGAAELPTIEEELVGIAAGQNIDHLLIPDAGESFVDDSITVFIDEVLGDGQPK